MVIVLLLSCRTDAGCRVAGPTDGSSSQARRIFRVLLLLALIEVLVVVPIDGKRRPRKAEETRQRAHEQTAVQRERALQHGGAVVAARLALLWRWWLWFSCCCCLVGRTRSVGW